MWAWVGKGFWMFGYSAIRRYLSGGSRTLDLDVRLLKGVSDRLQDLDGLQAVAMHTESADGEGDVFSGITDYRFMACDPDCLSGGLSRFG